MAKFVKKINKTTRSSNTSKGSKMTKTLKNKPYGNNKTILLRNFQREITVQFFEILLMIKLYHWKTYSYSTHKATDELYSKINEHMDKFTEVLLGKSGIRIDLTNKKNIRLCDLNNNMDKLISKIKDFKSYLVDLTNNKAIKLMSNTDLLNIRDEILGDLNQFLYLLSLK
jgi:DNA-binding ferritin-like protein